MTNPYPGGPEGWQQPGPSYPPPSPYAQPSAYPQPEQYPGAYQQPGSYQQHDPYSQGSPYQQPFPYQQPPHAPAPAKRSRVWIYVSLVAVLVVVLSAGAFFLIRAGRSGPAETTAASSPNPQAPKSTPLPPLEPGRGRPGPNTPPGWQSVASPSGFVYDVPADWAVHKPTSIIYWERPCPDGPFGFCPIRSLRNAASRPHPPQDGCKDSSTSALAGFLAPNPNEIPLAERSTISDAIEAEAKRVPDIYTDWGKDAPLGPPPPIARSEPRQFKINGADALQVSFTVTDINTSVGCNPPSSVYTVVATTNAAGTVVEFAVQTDQGYPQALDQATAQKIIDSLRPAEK
ncbi:hypothetical protein [Segniliparus rugosus]|uniref:DUF8017 domain-containing protein n=1 Tax=Segniliparus rugosus (strain ATCC BAA-974 / DSM 45345 / CCUG 50838 / CIP 108380 / JCM 13579 / CDC 945) TaxID=679197 RepID=E5XTX3_SEGRC|nr:hypothetical protein [Segniliparus rugosus]EFV12201.1 hypothetical protein HMPREF9336_02945 [Segniliparus rugosus ATCC BAA-974]